MHFVRFLLGDKIKSGGLHIIKYYFNVFMVNENK